MEIINEFGINPILLFAQVVNFLIILYILKRFAYKPILKILKDREKTIKQGLTQAEDARILLEKAVEKERNILKHAQAEAKKLLEESRAKQDEMMQQSEKATREQVDAMLKEAREQIAFETREAEKRLSGHISQLAIQFLQKSLSELFTEDEQDQIMKNALKKIKTKAD